MGRYTTKRVPSEQTAIAQGATTRELERNVNAEIGRLPAGSVITGIQLAGSGDGLNFIVMIQYAAVAEGLDADYINVRFFIAQLPVEIANQRAAAAARATAGYVLRDTEYAGAAKGLATCGMLVFMDPDSGETNGFWAQTTWYIDASSGDDGNTGLTALTALATHAEFERRIGQDFEINVEMTVNLMSDIDEVLQLRGRFGPAAAARIRYLGAVQTVVASGTIAAYTLPNGNPQPGGTEGSLTDAVIVDYTSYIGKRVKFTSGANAGSTTFISDTNSVGPTNARVGRYISYQTPNTPAYQVTGAPPAAADTYNIELLYRVRGFDFDVRRNLSTASGLNARPLVIIDGVFLHENSGGFVNLVSGVQGGNSSSMPLVVIARSSLSNDIACSGSAGVALYGCTCIRNDTGAAATVYFEGGVVALIDHVGGAVAFRNCTINQIQSVSYFDRGTYGANFGEGTVVRQDVGFGVFDASTSHMLLSGNSKIMLSIIWGDTPVQFQVDAQNGYVWYPAGQKPGLVGGIAAFRLGATNVAAWASAPCKNQPVATGGAPATIDDYHMLEY